MRTVEGKCTTADIGEGLLRVLIAEGTVGTVLIAPNALSAIRAPMRRYLDGLDYTTREHELRRAIYYAKRRGWIVALKAGYDGLAITDLGRQRIREVELNALRISQPPQWDKKWRLVLYDIPEAHKVGRNHLVRKLKAMGFYSLQRSVFVYPYPCREEIETLTNAHGIKDYVTYIETDHINRQPALVKKFSALNL